MVICKRGTILQLCIATALAIPLPAADSETVSISDTHLLGEPLVVEGVTVWPVFSSAPPEEPVDALPLHLAEKDGFVTVRDSGDVNKVSIQNSGSVPVVVLAGTLIKGGYQDRLLAVDIVIPAGKSLRVDAFCVEAGRWSGRREGVQTRGRFATQEVLAPHASRTSGQHARSQSAVWDSVALSNAQAGKAPATGTIMASIEDTQPTALAARQRVKDAVIDHFASTELGDNALVGLAYAVGEHVREVRIFEDPQLFGLYLDALVNTLSVEADLARRGEQPASSRKVSAADVVELVRRAQALEERGVFKKAGNRIVTAQNEDVATSATFLKGADHPIVMQYAAKQ
jgi:hypothetical protein